MNTVEKILLGFIFAGLLFSGYLAGTKFLSDTCAFNAPCPYFLGYPACYTGFLIYLGLLITFYFRKKREVATVFYTKTLLLLGATGVLFSGKFTLTEIPILIDDGFFAFVNSLPLCSIGFIFFVVILLLTFKLKKTENKNNA